MGEECSSPPVLPLYWFDAARWSSGAWDACRWFTRSVKKYSSLVFRFARECEVQVDCFLFFFLETVLILSYLLCASSLCNLWYTCFTQMKRGLNKQQDERKELLRSGLWMNIVFKCVLIRFMVFEIILCCILPVLNQGHVIGVDMLVLYRWEAEIHSGFIAQERIGCLYASWLTEERKKKEKKKTFFIAW